MVYPERSEALSSPLRPPKQFQPLDFPLTAPVVSYFAVLLPTESAMNNPLVLMYSNIALLRMTVEQARSAGLSGFWFIPNVYKPMPRLGEHMTPRLINAFQQTRFYRPYAVALRFNIIPGNRHQIDEWLVLELHTKRE